MFDDLSPSSPADSEADSGAASESPGGRVIRWLLVGLLVIFGGLYVAAWAYASDNVPRGTTVSGVRIGGHPQDQAADRLEGGLRDRLSRPIGVQIGDETIEVPAKGAGLSVDYDASVIEAGGSRSWDPRRLWNYYTGGDELAAVVDVDRSKLDRLVKRLNRDFGQKAVDGAVQFRGTRVVTRKPVSGLVLDADAASDALAAAWMSKEPTPATLAMAEVAPQIGEDQVNAARRDFANPAVASGVTLVYEGKEITLEPAAYVGTLSLQPRNGKLEPTLDGEALTTIVDERVGTDSEARDATWRLVGGQPRVVPARDGVTFDGEQLTREFLDVVDNESSDRTLELGSSADKPEVTTEEAESWQIKEQVSTFTTEYPHEDYRNTNIGRAAELINGTVLAPGETFSLNDIVGERTVENGFTEGYVISDGILVTDLGGGVSQMATTTYNAMYFAGLEDVEHKAHSFYISRYPVGREATVAWGSVDLKFRNDTDYGVLIEAGINPSTPSSSGSVTVTMYSTKVWDVSSRAGGRYAPTSPETRTISAQRCHANEGYGGFSIDVWRDWRRPGSQEVVRSEKETTTYIPSDTVVCTHPNPID